MGQRTSFGGNFIEALEDRRLMSSTLLSASAVEGSYKGSLVVGGVSHAIKVTITASKITATLVGVVSGSEKLSATALKKLRTGVFSFTDTEKGTTVTLSGKYTSGGLRISGSFSAKTGTTKTPGTFTLKK